MSPALRPDLIHLSPRWDESLTAVRWSSTTPTVSGSVRRIKFEISGRLPEGSQWVGGRVSGVSGRGDVCA